MPEATPITNGPIYVVHTLMHYNVGEFQIILGHGRPSTTPLEKNGWGLGYQVEWLTALSMSPPALKNLARQIADQIASYESKYGTIPVVEAEPPRDNVVSMNGLSPETLAALRAAQPQPTAPPPGEPEPPSSPAA